jgi:membrane-associated phospholipid phosphatase
MEKALAIYFWELRDTPLYCAAAVLSSPAYILLSSVLFILSALQLKRRFVPFLIAVLVSVSLSDLLCYRVLKPAIGRMRPKIELIAEETSSPPQRKDYSMPSNHAANIFAFFTVYALYRRRYRVLCLINSLLIASSRVVLVKHYPTDVLAGIVVGAAIGLCVVLITQKIEALRGSRHPSS